MSLKSLFLIYVELQRSADVAKSVYGTSHNHTKEAYERANEIKLKFISELDELEYRIESLEK
jgi:hypothetical protein